jgi:hypothetical protein
MVAAGRLQLPRRRQADCLTRKGNGETRRRSAGLTGVPEPVLATSIRSRTAGSQLLLMTMEAVTWSTIPARRQCASHLANDAGHCVIAETALGEVAEKMEGSLDVGGQSVVDNGA